MEIKKITFGKALLKTLLFEVVALLCVWGIIIYQLLGEHSRNYATEKIDFSFLTTVSRSGILNGENGTHTMFLVIVLLTLLFVFLNYFKKRRDVKLVKKILLSLTLSIISSFFFLVSFLLVYAWIIGNPFF